MKLFYVIGTSIELEERSFLYVVKRSMCLPPILARIAGL